MRKLTPLILAALAAGCSHLPADPNKQYAPVIPGADGRYTVEVSHAKKEVALQQAAQTARVECEHMGKRWTDAHTEETYAGLVSEDTRDIYEKTAGRVIPIHISRKTDYTAKIDFACQ